MIESLLQNDQFLELLSTSKRDNASKRDNGLQEIALDDGSFELSYKGKRLSDRLLLDFGNKYL